jgi:hypothetical protein
MVTHCPILPIRTRIILIVLVSMFCSVGRYVLAQQVKPNLTGKWKINLSKSKLAPQHGPGIDRYKIKHSEPRVEMDHLFNSGGETYSYVIAGKKRIVNTSLQDGPTRARAYWDGDTLVIEKQREIGSVGVSEWIDRYTLSQDGKSLVVILHANKSSFSAAIDESLIYERED